MSLKSTYHKFVSGITLAVMLWNIVGWLGTGLILNSMHAHDDEAHCAVSFCFCDVEDGRKICTCHHPELQPQNVPHQSNEHPADEHHMDENTTKGNHCYYAASHPPSQNSADSVWVFAKFNALSIQEHDIIPVRPANARFTFTHYSLLTGITGELLRPPRS